MVPLSRRADNVDVHLDSPATLLTGQGWPVSASSRTMWDCVPRFVWPGMGCSTCPLRRNLLRAAICYGDYGRPHLLAYIDDFQSLLLQTPVYQQVCLVKDEAERRQQDLLMTRRRWIRRKKTSAHPRIRMDFLSSVRMFLKGLCCLIHFGLFAKKKNVKIISKLWIVRNGKSILFFEMDRRSSKQSIG